MHIRNWAVVSSVLGGALSVRAAGPVDWPQFRGPGGLGVADAAKLPERCFASPAVDANSLYLRTATKLYKIAGR